MQHLGLILPNYGGELRPDRLAAAAIAAEEAGFDSGHEAPDLDDRIHRFALEVRPLIAG